MSYLDFFFTLYIVYENLTDDGLKCISNIRNRYDGKKRSPFDEAECGHHYGRAMASWSAIPALTGFHYSGVSGEIKFADKPGKFFWSTGYSYGMAEIKNEKSGKTVELEVLGGEIKAGRMTIEGLGTVILKKPLLLKEGMKNIFAINVKI